MEFASVTERTYLIDPAGHRSEQIIEHRTDPLTGNVASINTALAEKAKTFLGAADLELLNDLQEKSKAGCPFCSAAEKGTRYVPEIVPEGQLRVGSALAMPNLFSKCALDSVVIVDPRRHVLFPSKLGREALADAIRASAELLRCARAHDPSLVHHLVGMNFLNPGGSSVPHPHLQVHARSVPYSGIARALRKAADFHERTGRSYWALLIEREKEIGKRTVGRTGDVEWLAAFAPAHQREIWGVLCGKGSLLEIGDRDADAFADGISRVVTFYEQAGAHPFNFVFFSSPDGASNRSWGLQVRICSRPAFRPLYSNYDTWFGPKFVGDEVHTEAPERYAEALRARW
jgi:UDPglucose--hexose-1-phosphate uridylyltransferase